MQLIWRILLRTFGNSKLFLSPALTNKCTYFNDYSNQSDFRTIKGHELFQNFVTEKMAHKTEKIMDYFVESKIQLD